MLAEEVGAFADLAIWAILLQVRPPIPMQACAMRVILEILHIWVRRRMNTSTPLGNPYQSARIWPGGATEGMPKHANEHAYEHACYIGIPTHLGLHACMLVRISKELNVINLRNANEHASKHAPAVLWRFLQSDLRSAQPFRLMAGVLVLIPNKKPFL